MVSQDFLNELRKRVLTLLCDRMNMPESNYENLLPSDFRSMDDDRMGGYYVSDHIPPNFGWPVLDAKYIDTDNVEVNITLLVGDDGKPTGVEFWKVDFGSLKEFPTENEIFDFKLV